MKNRKLPRLPHGWKIVRNLTLTLLILAYIWNWYGCPIPDPKLNFRRMERTGLIGPSKIQGAFQDGRKDWWVMGTEAGQVVLFQSGKQGTGGTLSFWPREPEGPTLVPVPTWASQFDKEREIVAVNVPEGTTYARLTLTMTCWHPKEDLSLYQVISASPDGFDEEPLQWQWMFFAGGELLKDGGVLFRIVCTDSHTNADVNVASVERMVLGEMVRWDTYRRPVDRRAIDCKMEAVFYDQAANELCRATLSTPEGGEDNVV